MIIRDMYITKKRFNQSLKSLKKKKVEILKHMSP